MKRFLLLALLLGGSFASFARPIKGFVKCGKTPLEGVLLTDGYRFASTDDRGAFVIDIDDRALFLSVITPSGYVAPSEQGFPLFYRALTPKTRNCDFELQAWPESAKVYEMLAIADPQPHSEAHFGRLCTEIMPALRAETSAKAAQGVPQAAIILGDIVWDSPELFGRVKEQFAGLNVPVYPVIGNHDHDESQCTDSLSTANYRHHFGPTYYAFNLGRTHYIVLDNIIYHGKRQYDEQLDSTQLQWVGKYLEHLPAGSRLCIAMHASLMEPWNKFHIMTSATGLLASLKGYEVHFLTGHTHLNSNYDVSAGIMEHNVAQICGNLWRDPLNWDGSPKGFQLLREQDNEFSWHYQCLNDSPQKQMRVWLPGQVPAYKGEVVVKLWGWDPYWTVVWYEQGKYRGSMQRVTLHDPDFVARLDSLAAVGKKRKSHQPTIPTNFYFTAHPTKGGEVTIVATDRFGRKYTETITIK